MGGSAATADVATARMACAGEVGRVGNAARGSIGMRIAPVVVMIMRIIATAVVAVGRDVAINTIVIACGRTAVIRAGAVIDADISAAGGE